MITTKVFDHTINCKHPVKYASNLEENVMKDLEKQMKGKVFNNCYINNINNIIKISGIRISNTNPECHGYLNARFSAETINYCKGDIIPKATIIMEENQYRANTDTISILIRPEMKSITKLLSNGQSLPILLTGNPIYSNANKQVTAVGTILMPNIVMEKYKVEGTIDSSLVSKLESIISLIKKQDNMLKTDSIKNISKMFSKKSAENTTDILQLLYKSEKNEIDVSGVWYIDNGSFHSTLCVKKETDESVIHTNVYDAFKQILISIYMKRNAVIELSKYTKEEWDSSATIWKLMEK